MTNFAGLCLDLFLLGHAHVAAGLAGHGAAFEQRVRQHLDSLGMPNAGGFRVLGRRSASGLYHQLDEQTACQDALVVGEWKAYRGAIPKNDLLRFKAATDDYWLASATRCQRPILRVFGGTGSVSEAMRIYAAQWGIVLITPDAWPIPALCDEALLWRENDRICPALCDRRVLASLVRPLSSIFVPEQHGGWRMPALPSTADALARIRTWLRWSECAWDWWDHPRSGRFDSLIDQRLEILEGIAA